MSKRAVVIHSGGMDSSICLALAIKEFGVNNVVSLSFCYNQRHSTELVQAQKICCNWGVDHFIAHLECLQQLTRNALMNASIPIENNALSTWVVGRNGLMAHLGAVYAHQVGARCIYMGVIGVEGSYSGYPDCSRQYMDLQQQILCLDLRDPEFEIRTPLVDMTKKQTLQLADQMGILPYLLEETVTCYEGLRGTGCQVCPACVLRAQGLDEFNLS